MAVVCEVMADSILPGSHIITDNEDLFKIELVKDIINKKNLTILETDGFDPANIIKLMSQYREIDSNNSTLALWASIIGGVKLSITDPELKKFYNFINEK